MNFLFPVPAKSVITQTFTEHVNRAKKNGWCPQPGNCPSGIYYYGGIDWAVPTGTPVIAAQAGRVVVARHDTGGYGSHIRIEHDDDYLTIYGHLKDFAVRVGDIVAAGQVIGSSDNTGNSTGSHLHFELRKGGEAVNPALLLVESLGENTEQPNPESGKVLVAPGWNFRNGPGTGFTKLGTTSSPIEAELIAGVGDWRQVRVAIWVHAKAIGE